MARSPEREQFVADNARMARIASRHVRPEHVERALDHYAEALDKGMRDGRVADVDALTDAHHDAAFRSIAKSNPDIARPLPPIERTW